VALGLLVGLVASLLAGRVLSHLLFGVVSTDPGVLTSTTLILLGVAAAAILGPARRAARVDPARVLARE
jgi:ABC-type antimicrobial peptide transport system permease subunit